MRAWLAGIGLSLLAGPLGCFVVWRRMAYFGDTLAHAALLGIVFGVLMDIEPMLSVVIASAIIALLLVFLQQKQSLAGDTLLGILAHSSLALGLVVLSFIGTVRIDLLGYLFGDVLAVTEKDLAIIWGSAILFLFILMAVWQKLLLMTLHEELAQAEGNPVLILRFILVILIALAVAMAMKVVGILLITSMLIIPAATARLFVTTPERMALFACLSGMIAVTFGLMASFHWDTPAGPTIVVVALILFFLAQIKDRISSA